MIDEVLFMQVRLFRMFREATGLSAAQSNRLFDAGGAWDFIESCYDSLHLSGDDAALNDVCAKLRAEGVSW